MKQIKLKNLMLAYSLLLSMNATAYTKVTIGILFEWCGGIRLWLCGESDGYCNSSNH